MEPKFVCTLSNKEEQVFSYLRGLGNFYFLIHISILPVFTEMNIILYDQKKVLKYVVSTSYQCTGKLCYTWVQITHSMTLWSSVSFRPSFLNPFTGGCKEKQFFPSLYIYNTEYFWSPNVWGFSHTYVILRISGHQLGILQFNNSILTLCLDKASHPTG